jgi:hypothetical protein
MACVLGPTHALPKPVERLSQRGSKSRVREGFPGLAWQHQFALSVRLAGPIMDDRHFSFSLRSSYSGRMRLMTSRTRPVIGDIRLHGPCLPPERNA